MNLNIKKIIKISVLSLLIIGAPVMLLGAGIFTCSYAGSVATGHFKTVNLGDSRDIVVSKMGKPSHVEKRGDSLTRYVDRQCQNDCYERIWYEFSWCMGLQSWAIEFDQNGKVINKFEILSP